MKHIMAIGAHIGDVELTCGKTLATHSLKGDRISTVAITAGERGAPPDRCPEEFKQHNIDCASRFAEAIGGKFFCFGYPDGEAPDSEELRLAICDLIRAEKPDVILTHWHGTMHKDHRITSYAVTDAIYYAGLRGFERKAADGTVLPQHRANGPYFAENWEDASGFEPYIYIDVSPGYDLWYQHIQGLWLTNNSPWFEYRDYYDALSRQRGIRIRKKRAECFDVQPHVKRVVQEGF